jgi:hypothetical protein
LSWGSGWWRRWCRGGRWRRRAGRSDGRWRRRWDARRGGRWGYRTRLFGGAIGGAADEDDARRQDVTDDAAGVVDAHAIARPQRALKQSDDQRLADFGIGTLHGGAGRDGQTAVYPQRPALDVPFDDEVAFAADLTDDSRARPKNGGRSLGGLPSARRRSCP